jgi:hypothetical protein
MPMVCGEKGHDGVLMSDADMRFLHALETCQLPSGGFRHRDHVRAAWLYVTRDGVPAAIDAMDATIRQFAAHHGHAAKYHKTLTAAWVRLVAFHATCHPASEFEEFAATNPDLLDKALPMRFYSHERLFSPEAREGWIEPDRRALPMVAT